jgi:hypothetical protein
VSMRTRGACTLSEQLRAVIVKARKLAQRDLEGEYPDIAAADAAAAAKEEAAAAHKRQLLAELEGERMARHAAGDTRENLYSFVRAHPSTPPSVPPPDPLFSEDARLHLVSGAAE